MTVIDDTMISAYLDGELSAPDRLAFEQALSENAELADQLATLMAAEEMIQASFDAELEDDVPNDLIDAIMGFEETPVANSPKAPSGRGKWAMAASVAALMIGGVGGYVVQDVTAPPATVVASRGWLDDIADYHRIYSKQVRHLVEVGAEEADHIETWLTNTVGAPIEVADLSEFNLEFQGARLLVAAGKPVAQLVYTDPEGAVVALCIIQNPNPRDSIGVEQRGEFSMVQWGGDNANLVIVGDVGGSDIETIARSLAVDI